jgi:hypothetical protein
MDNEKLKEIFNEILKKYKVSETCVIENMAHDIKKELDDLDVEVENYHKTIEKLMA